MLRVLSLLFLALGGVILGTDLIGGLSGGAVLGLSSLGDWWFWAHPNSLQLLQPAVERHISPALFDPYIVTLLIWPAAIQFLVLGGLIWLIARPPWSRIRQSKM
ncbi:MAG: hypothetical protein AAFV19_20430 [Pseudomonadota bacterium]